MRRPSAGRMRSRRRSRRRISSPTTSTPTATPGRSSTGSTSPPIAPSADLVESAGRHRRSDQPFRGRRRQDRRRSCVHRRLRLPLRRSRPDRRAPGRRHGQPPDPDQRRPGGPADWTASQLRNGLAGATTARASRWHRSTPTWTRVCSCPQPGMPRVRRRRPREVVKPEVVIPAGVNGAVMFTAGCHAGLNQPYTAATRTDSWAKSLAGGAAAFYLANTGYGYGLDQPIIGYSEELLATSPICSSSTVRPSARRRPTRAAVLLESDRDRPVRREVADAADGLRRADVLVDRHPAVTTPPAASVVQRRRSIRSPGSPAPRSGRT